MRIIVSSELPIPVAEAWRRLQLSETLVFVATPVVTYAVDEDLPKRWEVGTKVNLRPRLFGRLPPSDHTVEFVRVDHDDHTMVTNESGGSITRWDHTMQIVPLSDHWCRYTDTIIIEAGLMTPFVWAFARFFYRHRHRRWNELLD